MYTLLFSETILAFVKRLESLAKQILSKELNLAMKGRRFCLNGYTYPIHIVVFEGSSRFGYFDTDTLDIGINKALLYSTDQTFLLNLLRHELAHYLVHLKYGPQSQPHGALFQEFCRSHGWGKEVSRAYEDSERLDQTVSTAAKEESILRKIKKLLSLAGSSNSNESQLATLKANELLVKHNLELIESSASLADDIRVVKRVLKQKRNSQKLRSIADILRTFFVRPVINHGMEHVYLEVFGSQVNVSVADYVALFLSDEFERLWGTTRRSNPHLKGATAKNSFFRGLSEGYCTKMQQGVAHNEPSSSRAIMSIEAALDAAMTMAYPNLRQSTSQVRHCAESTALGNEQGRRLTIHQGINSSSAEPGAPLLIGHK